MTRKLVKHQNVMWHSMYGLRPVIYINKIEEHLFLVDLVILCHIIIYYIIKVGLRSHGCAK